MIYVGGQVNQNKSLWRPEDGNNSTFRNAGVYLRNYLVSHCRWQRPCYDWFQCCVVVFILPVFSTSYSIPFTIYSPAFPLCCSPPFSFPPPKWSFFLWHKCKLEHRQRRTSTCLCSTRFEASGCNVTYGKWHYARNCNFKFKICDTILIQLSNCRYCALTQIKRTNRSWNMKWN